MRQDEYGQDIPDDPAQDQNGVTLPGSVPAPSDTRAPYTADDITAVKNWSLKDNGIDPNWGTGADLVSPYQMFRGQGQDHATALNSAVGYMGWKPQAAAAPAPAAAPGNGRTDANYIRSIVNQWGQKPGVNPSVASDPDYWVNAIIREGGLGDDNMGYWTGRFMTPEGAGGQAPQQSQGQAPQASGQSSPAPGADYSGLNAYIAQLMQQQQQQQQQRDEYRKGILNTVNGIISKNSDVPTADDPIIAGQVNAFRGEGERQARNAREAAAESGYAHGTPSGALDSLTARNSQAVGRNTGAFSAGLLDKELNARRSNLMGAAQLGAGIQTADQSNSLQGLISTLDANIRSLGAQGGQAIDWATLLQRPQLAQIAIQPGMASAANQKTSIGNQDTQFYDKFAYDMANGDQLSNLLEQYLLNGG